MAVHLQYRNLTPDIYLASSFVVIMQRVPVCLHLPVPLHLRVQLPLPAVHSRHYHSLSFRRSGRVKKQNAARTSLSATKQRRSSVSLFRSVLLSVVKNL